MPPVVVCRYKPLEQVTISCLYIFILPVLRDCRQEATFYVLHYSVLYISSVPAVLVCRYKPLGQVAILCVHILIVPVLRDCRLEATYHVCIIYYYTYLAYLQYWFVGTNHCGRSPYNVYILAVLHECRQEATYHVLH